jgi:hypothetical protein
MDKAARSRANPFHCKTAPLRYSRIASARKVWIANRNHSYSAGYHMSVLRILSPYRLAGVAFAMALLEENHPVLIDDLTNRSRIAGEV